MNNSIFSQEKNDPIPKIAFGVGGFYGFYDVIHNYGEGNNWEEGDGYGGGIIFEAMISNRFGIHSGIWYSQFTLTLEITDYYQDEEEGITQVEWFRNEVKSEIITVPIYLITSFRLSVFTFNLLTGFNFSYVTESSMSTKTMEGKESAEIKKYIGYSQAGVGGGLEIKISLPGFIDIFFTGTGERYFNNLFNENKEWSDFLYNYKAMAGIMMRTF